MSLKSPSFAHKLDTAIEAVFYALLAFMPLAFGVVHAWSEEVVILAAGVLMLLCGWRQRAAGLRLGSWALVPVGVFVLVPVLQWVPLPAGLTRILASSTWQTKTELVQKLNLADNLQSNPSTNDQLPATNSLNINNVIPVQTGTQTSNADSLPLEAGSTNLTLNSQFSTLNSDKMSLTFYPHATWQGLRLVLAIACIFLAALQTFRTSDRIKRLLSCIALVGGAVAVLALLQNISRTDKIYWLIPSGRSIAEAGPFVNHSNFGQFMNLSIGAALALTFVMFHEAFTHRRISIRVITEFFQSPAGKVVWLLAGAVILGIAAIFVSMTRGGMIAFLIAASFTTLMLAMRGSVRGRGWIMTLLALGAFICVLYIGFDAVYDRLASLREHNYTGEGSRWQIVKDISSAWTKFPIFGTGLGTHVVVYPMFDRSTIPSLAAHAENEYAQLAEEMGLAGLLPMLLFGVLVWMAYTCCIRSAQKPIRSAAYGLGYGLLAILIQSLSDFGQHLPANAVLSAIFCAVLFILARPEAPKFENGKLKIENSPSSQAISRQLAAGSSNSFLHFALAIILFCLVFSPYGADAARRAESHWSAVQDLDAYLTGKDWQATNAEFAELIRAAQEASDLQPQNMEYRHWLNVYRWRLVSSYTDAAGNMILTDKGLDSVRRLAGEFARGLESCPTYGQSWSMAGQLLYFVLAPAQANSTQLKSGRAGLAHAEAFGSSPEAIASGMHVQDGVQKPASNSDMDVHPAVSLSETGLNPSVNPVQSNSSNPSVPSVANSNLQSTICNLQSKGADLILTGYRLAPCDATVCFVAGLLEIEEYKSSIENPQSSISTNYELPTANSSNSMENRKLKIENSNPSAANNNLQSTIDNLQSDSSVVSNEILNSQLSILNSKSPGFLYFSRAIQLAPRFYPDCAREYLAIARPDLVVALAGDQLSFLSKAATLLSESQASSDLADAARAKVAMLLEQAAALPDASAGTLASLAAIYAKAGRTEEAVALYRRALGLDYGNISWRLALARLLADMGDSESAIKEARIVLRLKPNYAPTIKLIEELSTK